jgi:hypothetical protein
MRERLATDIRPVSVHAGAPVIDVLYNIGRKNQLEAPIG